MQNDYPVNNVSQIHLNNYLLEKPIYNGTAKLRVWDQVTTMELNIIKLIVHIVF